MAFVLTRQVPIIHDRIVKIPLSTTSVGNIYIGELGNNRVRKVTASTSVISTVAGTGTASYSGDNGQATSATISGPVGVAVDSSGNFLNST